MNRVASQTRHGFHRTPSLPHIKRQKHPILQLLKSNELKINYTTLAHQDKQAIG